VKNCLDQSGPNLDVICPAVDLAKDLGPLEWDRERARGKIYLTERWTRSRAVKLWRRGER
jgi:hypothetical protein